VVQEYHNTAECESVRAYSRLSQGCGRRGAKAVDELILPHHYPCQRGKCIEDVMRYRLAIYHLILGDYLPSSLPAVDVIDRTTSYQHVIMQWIRYVTTPMHRTTIKFSEFARKIEAHYSSCASFCIIGTCRIGPNPTSKCTCFF
jgi:hypothetical protein